MIGVVAGFRANFLLAWHPFQHWKANALCERLDAAMLSCHRSMDVWLIRNHSFPLYQASPLPCVRSTEFCVWRREFIVVAIERILAILRNDDTCDQCQQGVRVTGQRSGFGPEQRSGLVPDPSWNPTSSFMVGLTRSHTRQFAGFAGCALTCRF